MDAGIALRPSGSPHRESAAMSYADRAHHVPRRSAHLADADRDGVRRLAADEVIRGYLQSLGELPRSLGPSIFGARDLAQPVARKMASGPFLMGCRPTWDHSTGRGARLEVLPCA